MRLSEAYKNAVELLKEGSYDDAAKAFSKLGDYKDSDDKYLQCFYEAGIDDFEDSKYRKAIEYFEKSKGYKDSAERIKETHYMLAEEEYDNGNYISASEEYALADDFKDAKDKYAESIYEYGKSLASLYDYDAAAEQLGKIEYKDSKELAERYRRMESERFFDDKFYYDTDEFALLMKQNLAQESSAYSAKKTGENTNGAYIELYYYGSESEACVMLIDVDKEEGSIGEIDYLWNDIGDQNRSLEVGALYFCIRLADLTMSSDEAKALATNMLEVGVKKQRKNGIVYESALDISGALGVRIYSENKSST